MDNPGGRVAAIKKLAKVFLDKGFYDEDPDIPTLREAAKSLREAKELTPDEFSASFEFVIELLSLADSEQKKKMKERANRVYHSRIHASKYALILWLMVNWMDKNADDAVEILSSTLQTSISLFLSVYHQKLSQNRFSGCKIKQILQRSSSDSSWESLPGIGN